MFQAPPDVTLSRKTLVWPPKQEGEKPITLFELRAGDVQDILPPTVHPETGNPYVWLVPPNSEFPLLPETVLELWQHWDSYRKELESMCPWGRGFRPETAPRDNGAWPNVIAAFNDAHQIEGLIESHGYKRRGNRWVAPTSTSELAGVVVLDGVRVYSHHASDPLAGDHSHDAFDVFRILDHNGDTKAAVKAAAEALGIPGASVSNQNPIGKQADGQGAEIVCRRVADIVAKPIRWLWPGKIARGKVSMLAGHPGLGKSQVTVSMAAVVSTGGLWPVSSDQCERGSVIILSAEDDPADTIRPRLEAVGADLNRVHTLDAVREPNKNGVLVTRSFNLAVDIERFGGLAKQMGDVALIVIDPITAYLGGVDSHKNADVRGLLAPLASMAAERNAAIVCVSHLTKSGGNEAMLRVMGSLGFVAAARAAYLVGKDPEDDKRRLFLPMKNNLADDTGGLAFWVRGHDLGNGIWTSCVEWDSEPVTMTADELMRPEGDPEERSALNDAMDWLRALLCSGELDSKQIRADARQSGISWRTVERAKGCLGIKSVKEGFGKTGAWSWRLPSLSSSTLRSPNPDTRFDGLSATPYVARVSGDRSAKDRQGNCTDGLSDVNDFNFDDAEAF